MKAPDNSTQFPEMWRGQYAVSFFCKWRGRIMLFTAQQWYNVSTHNPKDVYVVFHSLDAARRFVATKMRENTNAEAMIFDADKNVVEELHQPIDDDQSD